MRIENLCPDSLRLNAIAEGLPAADDSNYARVFGLASRRGSLSTNPQRERGKEAKKERENTTTIFVSKIGNSNCRQREIIIDARHIFRVCLYSQY